MSTASLTPVAFGRCFVLQLSLDDVSCFAFVRRSSDSVTYYLAASSSQNKSHTANQGGGTVRWSNGCLLLIIGLAFSPRLVCPTGLRPWPVPVSKETRKIG
ncbi:uncharacterized protein BDW47DRAFT_120993 [Aspergillus candidus]|uniref:Uncharacterized protein n=1 Tax=Aspergillus candidus TaxID=41067 RepID=A0A2I2EZ64_ASPCN|nr:hypothetical protein BDW47DRAFT_120993 [Aspergillus candidus]PLB33668.1 hypothetical protein BDW47DRAFT_120993 [Aspergillus candidus]